MTELVQGRPLVPTRRQVEVGDLPAPVVLDLPPDDESLTRGGWRKVLSDLDPRHVQGPKLVLLVLCLTSLFARIDDAALGVLLPEIRADFGVSLAFFGVLSSLVGIVATALTLPMGYLADRVKRVWMVRIGSLATAATVAVQGLVPNVTSLVGARLANGVAQGVAQPASFPLMSDWFPPVARARVFGIYLAAAQIGLIVGPVTAGLLADTYGWRPTLLVLGSLAFGAGLLTFLLREPVRGRYDRPDALDRPAPPALGFAASYRAAASISTLRRCWYVTPLLSARGTLTFLVLPVFLSEVYGLSSTELGIVQAVNGTVGLLGLLFAGVAGDRLLSSRPGRYMLFMGLAPIAQAAALTVVAFTPPIVVAVIVLQLVVLLEAVLQPAFYSVIAFVVPSRIRGLGLAAQAPWQLLGLIGTPFLLAAIEGVGLEKGLLLFVPLFVLAGLILGTGASGVERDIRAARAADAAEDALRKARASGQTPLLVCRDVQVAYGGVQVLFGVDLDVQAGEVVALVGTNGAGKSTLLRALAGTSQPSGGAVFFDDRDTTHLPPHELAALGIVSMPGGAAVFPSLSVRENLRAAAWTIRDDEAVVAQRTGEVLDLFPVLRERLDSPAGTLSGGEQQMVGLSQALLMEPRLLLVDELSLGLAPSIVEQLLGVLREVNARGTTIVLVEQSLNVALTIADRAVFMEKGEIRFDGPTEELLARPDLVRSVFMGGAAGGTRAVARKPFTDTATTPALEVRDLAVRFGGVSALRGVDLAVAPGEVVGIIGPNGAGKTTLFDLVSGFTRPDRGAVLLAGVDVTAASPDARARAGLGRSFQSARLFPALTVRENVLVALERSTVRNPLLASVWAPQVRSSERRLSRRVDRLVDLMGLEAYADATLAELSTGSRRAVDVACILASEPSMLLLDEPSSGLAQAETEALGPLLQRIVRETGCGMLVIEHDLPLVTALSDRMVAMEGGAVLVTGTPAEVRSDPRVLASYLAASDDVVQRSGRMGALAAALDQALDDSLHDDPEKRT